MSAVESTAEMACASRNTAISIAILAFSAFLIVTTEFLIVGLDLGISIAVAGQRVTLFAFTVMVFGPPLTTMLSHVDRKQLFIAILVLFAASNALAARRGAFWLLAGLSLLIAVAMWSCMPTVARSARVDFMKQARSFKAPAFLANRRPSATIGCATG